MSTSRLTIVEVARLVLAVHEYANQMGDFTLDDLCANFPAYDREQLSGVLGRMVAQRLVTKTAVYQVGAPLIEDELL